MSWYPAGNINIVKFTEDNEYVLAGIGPSNADLNIYKIIRGGTATDSPAEIKGGLYPNPANDVLMVKIAYSSMTIYDLQGRPVMHLMANATTHDISGLPGGSYFMKAIDQDRTHLMRFIKI